MQPEVSDLSFDSAFKLQPVEVGGKVLGYDVGTEMMLRLSKEA